MKLDEMLRRMQEYYTRDIIPPQNFAHEYHDDEIEDADAGVVASPDIDMDGEGEEEIDENIYARMAATTTASNIVNKKKKVTTKPKPTAKKKPAKKKGGFINRLFGRK